MDFDLAIGNAMKEFVGSSIHLYLTVHGNSFEKHCILTDATRIGLMVRCNHNLIFYPWHSIDAIEVE